MQSIAGDMMSILPAMGRNQHKIKLINLRFMDVVNSGTCEQESGAQKATYIFKPAASPIPDKAAQKKV